MWKQSGQRHMGFDDRRLQDDEAEIFVDADIHVGEPLHGRPVFVDAGGDEFQQIIVAAGMPASKP